MNLEKLTREDVVRLAVRRGDGPPHPPELNHAVSTCTLPDGWCWYSVGGRILWPLLKDKSPTGKYLFFMRGPERDGECEQLTFEFDSRAIDLPDADEDMRFAIEAVLFGNRGESE